MGAAAETIQFNTRIERSLKLAGDDVLKRAGYSPSQAVRALWRKQQGAAKTPRPSSTCWRTVPCQRARTRG